MNVLLSIKPKYANQILNGNKRYEFRKSVFNYRDLEMVYIYSSSPIKRIVGAFAIKSIIEKHPVQLWNECKDFSGIDEEDFFDYFRGKDKGFAIEIGDVEVFDPINPKDHIRNFVPPQSFCYTDKQWSGNLQGLHQEEGGDE
jgi:predicted transcriptional regulator